MPPIFLKEQNELNKNPPSGGFLSEYLGKLCRQNTSAYGGHHRHHHACLVHTPNVTNDVSLSISTEESQYVCNDVVRFGTFGIDSEVRILFVERAPFVVDLAKCLSS